MELLENGELAAGKPNAKEVAAAPAAQARRTSESRSHCAYNQTRECFLGLEVTTADLPSVKVGEVMAARPLKSGEGLWLMPYRGIPAAATPAPLDLIYLDAECQVIDIVESFPTFQVSSSSPKPESVLALPAHSIYSSQTQAGDQLVICVAEEMQQQLERVTNSRNGNAVATGIAGAALLREKPLWSGGPGLLELENRNSSGDKATPETYVMDLTPPASKASRQPRNWLERWWSPDPRKAPRAQAPGVAAYYWNGSAPAAHGIRDISSSGLYVVTEERWYPGTLVLMSLQTTASGEEVQERTIAVQTRAVRWGPDGVGLQFILPEKHDVRRDKVATLDAASRKELERFLEQLKKVK